MDKYKDATLFSKPVEDMTDAERESAIAELERMRSAIITEIEDTMDIVAEETRDRRFRRKRARDPLGDI